MTFRLTILMLITSLILFSFATNRAYYTSEPYELKYPANFGNRFTIPQDNPLTKEGVHLGRMLFYETQLSSNNKISCASCHQQKFAFADPRPLSIGVDSTPTPRNSMSLSNLLWARSLFWDGRVGNLEEQAVMPLTDPHEMGQSLEQSVVKLKNLKTYSSFFQKAFGSDTISGERIKKALAQFERILISADSKYDQYLRGEYIPTVEELEGLKLFMSGPSPEKGIRGANCSHCHTAPKTFSELFHNNGLDTMFRDTGRAQFTNAEIDIGRFRVPTLRNIVVTAPYMHDGRFNSLEQVLNHYSDHIQRSATLSPFISEVSNEHHGKQLLLTPAEKRNIIEFLKMLTDSTFITNPDFSDPHLKKIPGP